MARETTIAQRGVSKRTMAQANQRLSGDARIRSAIYSRAFDLMDRAREQQSSSNRVMNALNSMLRRAHV